ncbi:deoxycytidylate deaminase [Marmota monax]|uniref:Deoxycytidylate deaminase n=2 Tax=Marmota monax TaxID=9995 RepID=A0A834QTA7_MARMO|nr:deoxycytidylate deaminase [Marmota monax]
MRLPAAVRTVPARRRAAAPSERAPRWPLPPSGHAAAPPPLAISFPWARFGGVGGGEDEHRPAGQRSPHRSGWGRPCGFNMSEVSCKKRDDYLEWPEYFMAVAFLSAQRSKDPNSQVGACIVNTENKIVGIGYNGMPNGCSDDLLPWRRTADNKLDTKYPYVCHAELNAIMNKNSADVKGCSMYVALFPCNECAKLIIQAGIKEVIFMSDKYHDSDETTAARLMFEMAGVTFRKFTPKCSKIVIDFDSINSRPSQKLQ